MTLLLVSCYILVWMNELAPSELLTPYTPHNLRSSYSDFFRLS